MSFRDLPQDWPDIPLTDPTHTADVLDIFVSMKTRMNGGLLVLVCDPLRRPLQPVLVEDFGSRPPEDGDQALKNLATRSPKPSQGPRFCVRSRDAAG